MTHPHRYTPRRLGSGRPNEDRSALDGGHVESSGAGHHWTTACIGPLFRWTRLPASLLVLLACLAAAPASARESPLVMGIISTESSSQLRKGFDPFVEVLSRKIGMPLKAYFATDYAGVIEALRFNKAQIAWVGNKSAIEAVDRAGAEVFAQITKADGDQGYHSVMVVRKDSPWDSIDELLREASSLTFGNGDPNSTSGYLIPSYYLWSPRGIDPNRHFKRSRHANHEVNCVSVAMGMVDFAAANDEALERFSQSRPKLAERLRVIWQSPRIPNDPIVWRSDLPAELKSRIRKAFMEFGRSGPEAEKELEILANIQDGWGPFEPSDNQQLLPIREIALESEIQAVRNSPLLGDKAKQERLRALKALQADLARQSPGLR